MVLLGGPKLTKMVDELATWYSTTRQILIAALEEGGPYGQVKLSPQEQLDKFLNMTPEDWAAMADRLRERFRGLPDAEARVKQALTDFINHVYGIEGRLGRGPS